MQEIIEIDYKANMIIHFKQDAHPQRRTTQYQVFFNPDRMSPSGEFIRFSQNPQESKDISEVHGWVKLEDIVVDEILERISEEVEEETEYLKENAA